MMKRTVFAIGMVFVLLMGEVVPQNMAAAAVKLTKTKVTVVEGKATTVKVKNYKKTVSFSSSNKKIATTKKIGKYTVKITGKKKGTTKVYAKCGKKRLGCKVTVKAPKPKETECVETVKPTVKPSTMPATTPSAEQKYLSDQSVVYSEAEGVHRLFFSFKLSDRVTRGIFRGNASVKIVNSDNDVVYEENIQFTEADYKVPVKDKNGITGYLCEISIKDEDVRQSTSELGTIYYGISLEDGSWFAEKSKGISNLPLIFRQMEEETVAPMETKMPTVEPTLAPTQAPTVEPTVEPTMVVTNTPTISPTPTLEPTATVEVTETPLITETPSISPTPTLEPTKAPSRDDKLEQNISRLKQYLMQEGVRGGDGSYYIYNSLLMENRMFGVGYNPYTKRIIYEVVEYKGFGQATLALENDPLVSAYTTFTYRSYEADYDNRTVGIASKKTSELCGNEYIQYLVMGEKAGAYVEVKADELLSQGYTGWDSLLAQFGLGLQDLGFDSYGEEKVVPIEGKYPIEDTTCMTYDTVSRLRHYIQNTGVSSGAGISVIYCREAEKLYSISYDQNSDLFTFDLRMEDMRMGCSITVNPWNAPVTQYCFEDYASETLYGEVMAEINIREITGREVLDYQVYRGTIAQNTLEMEGNLMLQYALRGWRSLTECAGLSMQQVGFESYRS